MDLSVQRLKHSGADASGGGEDRLSDLPDDVLIDILVLVDDAAEAARTSVLASRWRRLWTLLPELSFNFIGHHRIDAALAAHQVPDLSLLFVLIEDPYPEFLSEWLPAAARALSGHIDLEVFRPDTEPVAEERGDIDLPCFERATSITLKLGFLGLALPSSGVFARLGGLQLVDVRLHGQSGLGELLSSQRCPSLKSVIVRQARGLDSFNIHSESLLNIELSNLHCLQQLTVIAPVLESLRVKNCFTNPLDPDLSVANISAPQLKLLDWMNAYDPSSIQLDNMMHLENLGIKIFLLEGEEEAVERNLYCMTLLWRFDHIRTLDLLISYPPDICTGPYLMEHMPKLHITILALGIMAYGHCFGASVFDVLMRCRGLKRLDLDFLPRSQLGEQTPCPSGCICDQQPKWKTEELALNCLEEIEIHDMRGTEHEVALVQRLFHWAIVLKRLKIVLHELITESKAKELRQLLLSFSRLDICIDISTFVP